MFDSRWVGGDGDPDLDGSCPRGDMIGMVITAAHLFDERPLKKKKTGTKLRCILPRCYRYVGRGGEKLLSFFFHTRYGYSRGERGY